ncbi:putative mitochondrial hypothetical protein [Leptomonas pyrrhocoris]|uniref:ARMET C-terminal domain-containing protein n=1 Tax=Leptomonas pyrrhocoris TaxID=157538 RepID=A0A0M9FPB4_LEPPY|nr:putative mitochondrial hypothetical protein [Leptomonas pyrrhocoris]XP_015651566.1 putative mitochondrial hypothetical protein [Leptomonas pyrrhocoris]KPA73126.1 putative mitochondrial hypothetical protein [Leptomonas pyrrhocoris]KPA73127.1 putative mitochondrial hypothetical protein [Leptomonas pyrrhocoris]|eukprot:XP_015651565.1 putative mitochondrial hypothetical protein [Leptomonas pyrrhocoris]
MRRLQQLCVFLCFAALLGGSCVVTASLLTEVPPEQVFLLHRRRIGTTDESDLRAITRGLPTSTAPHVSLEHLHALSSRQLSKIIKDRSSECYGCVERNDLVQRAYEVQRQPTMDERVAWQLTVSDRGLMTMTARHDNIASITGSFLNTDCQVLNQTIYCQPRGI